MVIGLIIGIILNITVFIYANYGAVCYEGCPFYPHSLRDFLMMGVVLIVPTLMSYLISKAIQKSTAHRF